MEIFKKPQNPMEFEGTYFYPLTTCDQIILDNNNRLSDEMIFAGEIDGEDVSMVSVNADTLNGKPEELLSVANAAKLNNKTENMLNVAEAVNASKLGGKTEDNLSVLNAVNAENSENANKLGGQSPSYYATAAGAVKKAGDTMTGRLTLSADPTSNLHAATKQYVDGLRTTLLLNTTSVPTTETTFSITDSWKNYREIYVTVKMHYSSSSDIHYQTGTYYPAIIRTDYRYVIFRDIPSGSGSGEGSCTIKFVSDGTIMLKKAASTYNGCAEIWVHGIK